MGNELFYGEGLTRFGKRVLLILFAQVHTTAIENGVSLKMEAFKKAYCR